MSKTALQSVILQQLVLTIWMSDDYIWIPNYHNLFIWTTVYILL